MELGPHHALWTHKKWNKVRPAKRLREDLSLLIPMDPSVHNQLHVDHFREGYMGIPLLGSTAMHAVLMEYNPTMNYYDNVERVAKLLDQQKKDPQHELAAAALRFTLPYIEFGALRKNIDGS